MKRAHRLYLFRRQLGIFALFSFFFNGMVGWLLYQPLTLPWTGVIVGTDALIVIFVTAALIGPAIMAHGVQKIRRAQLPPVARRSRSRAWIQWLPTGAVARSAVIALAVAVVVVPLALGLLAIVDGGDVNPTQFVLIRAILAAGVAGVMAAVFAWIGLVEASD